MVCGRERRGPRRALNHNDRCLLLLLVYWPWWEDEGIEGMYWTIGTVLSWCLIELNDERNWFYGKIVLSVNINKPGSTEPGVNIFENWKSLKNNLNPKMLSYAPILWIFPFIFVFFAETAHHFYFYGIVPSCGLVFFGTPPYRVRIFTFHDFYFTPPPQHKTKKTAQQHNSTTANNTNTTNHPR